MGSTESSGAILVIRPYHSFGPVRFGMAPEEVEQTLGPPDDVIEQAVEPPEPEGGAGGDSGWVSPRWYYKGIWLAVDFSARDGLCEFVVCASPAVAVIEGVEGLELTGSAQALLAALAERGHALRYGRAEDGDADFAYLDEFGVVVGWDPEGEIESVAAWRPGYWDEGADET